jgi:hypothetical protein
MKKFFKELGEQYDYTWWWLLEQGMIFSAIIVNALFLTIFTIVMGFLILFLKWMGKN